MSSLFLVQGSLSTQMTLSLVKPLLNLRRVRETFCDLDISRLQLLDHAFLPLQLRLLLLDDFLDIQYFLIILYFLILSIRLIHTACLNSIL